MLELIISYFLTKFNIITKKPNNPDCHLNHSVSMAQPNNIDVCSFLSICKLRLLDIFTIVKSICFPFGQTRYDMNSRCRKATYRAVRHIECEAHIENSSEFISMHCFAMLCSCYNRDKKIYNSTHQA